MPLPASGTTLNGLTIDGSMNDMMCSMYGAEHSCCVSRPGVAAGGGIVPLDEHVADLADAGVAAERERLAAHHLDAVVLAGLCDAVIWAPP